MLLPFQGDVETISFAQGVALVNWRVGPSGRFDNFTHEKTTILSIVSLFSLLLSF